MIKGDWKLVIGLVLAVLVIGFIVVDPMSEQQIIPTEAEYTYEFSDLQSLTGVVQRDQEHPDAWGDLVVWMDYRNGHYDIWGYNFSSENFFQATTSYSNCYYPSIYDNTIVWYQSQLGTTDVAVFFQSNLTTYYIHNESVSYTNPRIYGDNIVYTSFDGQYHTHIYLYDLSTNTESLIRDDLFGSVVVYSLDIWGDKVAVKYYTDVTTVCYYNITTGSTVVVESDVQYSGYDVCIWENYIIYQKSWDVKMYNIDTGQTKTIYQTDSGYTSVCESAHDGLALIVARDSAYHYNYTLYDIENDELIFLDDYDVDLGTAVPSFTGTEIHGDKIIVHAERYDSVDTDIYTIDINRTSVATPTTPTPSSRGEAVQEFIQDYWAYMTVGIIGIAGVVAVEGYKYQWEHFKALNERVNVGLLASLIIIITIIGIWIGFGV